MLPEVQEFHGYLTDMCRGATFGSAVSATNYAVEGVAQKISEKALRGLAKNEKIGPRGRWLLVIVLRVLLEPPASARPDLLVLREPTQRLLGDLLRHALHCVVRRRHRLTERRGAAHLGEVGVELLHLVNHGLRGLEAHSRNIEAVSHRAPHGVVPALDPDVVPEERLAVFR